MRKLAQSFVCAVQPIATARSSCDAVVARDLFPVFLVEKMLYYIGLPPRHMAFRATEVNRIIVDYNSES